MIKYNKGPVDKSKNSAEPCSGPGRIVNWEIEKDGIYHSLRPGVKFCVSDFRQESRMALESKADSGLNPLITESHGGQNGMRAGTA